MGAFAEYEASKFSRRYGSITEYLMDEEEDETPVKRSGGNDAGAGNDALAKPYPEQMGNNGTDSDMSDKKAMKRSRDMLGSDGARETDRDE